MDKRETETLYASAVPSLVDGLSTQRNVRRVQILHICFFSNLLLIKNGQKVSRISS